eukprot:gnl/Hemi2/3704_TR1298_c0_g1_i1.p1 gnl/Hemi2/3704_TR1298_c0_g1~~gnl/Hemi2/3704_TR1298_c0_g1_i1.p1  ORF type:complete len:222 (+),score=69.17 gnl/Hemi2/3704_TR1298_c0_g1_i1:104-769(+)
MLGADAEKAEERRKQTQAEQDVEEARAEQKKKGVKTKNKELLEAVEMYDLDCEWYIKLYLKNLLPVAICLECSGQKEDMLPLVEQFTPLPIVKSFFVSTFQQNQPVIPFALFSFNESKEDKSERRKLLKKFELKNIHLGDPGFPEIKCTLRIESHGEKFAMCSLTVRDKTMLTITADMEKHLSDPQSLRDIHHKQLKLFVTDNGESIVPDQVETQSCCLIL